MPGIEARMSSSYGFMLVIFNPWAILKACAPRGFIGIPKVSHQFAEVGPPWIFYRWTMHQLQQASFKFLCTVALVEGPNSSIESNGTPIKQVQNRSEGVANDKQIDSCLV